ncbi:hypothetical protein HDU96_000782 [Phlyctochytrium bullatum]|nr:hypothetical protein HDU96_000782 [Phlyctochytrium bullatum]
MSVCTEMLGASRYYDEWRTNLMLFNRLFVHLLTARRHKGLDYDSLPNSRDQEDLLERLEDPSEILQFSIDFPIPSLSAFKEAISFARGHCNLESDRTQIAKVESRLATFEGLQLLKDVENFAESSESTGEAGDNSAKDLEGDDAQCLAYIPWIRDEITPLLRVSDDQYKFCEWIETKVRRIERYARSPSEALQFFSLVNALLFQKDTLAINSAFVENTVTPGAYILTSQRSASLLKADLYNLHSGIGKRLLTLKEQLQDIIFLAICPVLEVVTASFVITSADLMRHILAKLDNPYAIYDASVRYKDLGHIIDAKTAFKNVQLFAQTKEPSERLSGKQKQSNEFEESFVYLCEYLFQNRFFKLNKQEGVNTIADRYDRVPGVAVKSGYDIELCKEFAETYNVNEDRAIFDYIKYQILQVKTPSYKSAVSRYRSEATGDEKLPFQDLYQNPEMVLYSRLQDTSSSKYLPLAKFLGIDPDKICKRIVDKECEKLKELSAGGINEVRKESAFKSAVERVRSVVQRVQSPETAFQIAMDVSSFAPDEELRLIPLHMAQEVVEKWIACATREAEMQQAHSALERTKSQIIRTKTAVLLTKNGLSAYCSLIERPRDLIERLYIDCSASALMKQVTFDLHSIINDIGDFYAVDTKDIRSRLFQLATSEDLEQAGKNYTDLREYLKMLLFLADFEELQIVHSLKEFRDCSKEALARSLWLRYGKSLKVLQLITNICFEYEVQDLKLWEQLLKGLIQQDAILYLLSVCEHLLGMPRLLELPALPALWKAFLRKTIDYCVCFEEELKDKDFVQAIANTIGNAFGKFEALLGIYALPRSQFSLANADTLLHGLTGHHLIEIYTQSIAEKHILSSAILRKRVAIEMDNRDMHELVQLDPCFPQFVKDLLDSKRVDRLLSVALKGNRKKACMKWRVGVIFSKYISTLDGTPLIDYWLKILKTVTTEVENFVVCNAANFEQFKTWAASQDFPIENILNDGSANNETRCGAVADMALAVEHFQFAQKGYAGVLVVAGDTLFLDDFNMNDFLHEALAVSPDCLVTSYTEMRSKNLDDYDATGKYLQWLIYKTPVYAVKIGGRLDIGGLNSLIEAEKYLEVKGKQ